jgi:hypothetical protein
MSARRLLAGKEVGLSTGEGESVDPEEGKPKPPYPGYFVKVASLIPYFRRVRFLVLGMKNCELTVKCSSNMTFYSESVLFPSA